MESGIRKRKRKQKRKRIEYGIRERRFQAIDLKKIYISNDNEISKHTLKKDTNE